MPALLILAIFRFLPMLEAFYLSFTDYDLISPPRWVGLQNFIDLTQDPLFLKSVQVSLIYVSCSVIPVIPLSLGLAILFNRALLARNFLRSAIFMPVVMPAVVMAVVWTFMYQQDGVMNTILGWVGIDPVPWLRSSSTALWSVIMIGIWRAVPYYMVIFLAGLQAIPRDYYDAAKIDGAGSWATFRYITLPLLKPTMLLVVVMNVIVAMKVFAVPMIMTGGGPGDATRVLPLFIYQTAFEFFDMGKASAMSVVMFAILMAFAFIQVRLFTRKEEQ
ncbi:carbohydrate ABC transporter permease [Pseudogemmobacter bohemicus]|uniref:carbohydrate ABC transporter permease n=1 Tax=Pseudogemmobacter bohemicus TaxID=2250708 RepID=UPI0013003C5F|nr:sugar ABC transporter permease [Pseudogemmobacter bohemicus]